MDRVFSAILGMSVRACWVIAAVLLVRLLLRRAPKWVLCALWLLPAIRLCCPVFPEAWFSLLPRRSAAGLLSFRAAESGAAAGFTAPAAVAAPSPFPLFAVLWLAGVCLMLAYALISWMQLRRRVSASLTVEKDVRVCDEVQSPFILGVFRPVICLPSSLRSPDLEQVLAHERAHLRRRDHRWKPLGWLILSLHWFNPLCWLAYILFCRDTEAACDERVVRDLDREGQAAYAQALLNCGAPRRLPAACPLAFGETGVKGRVKSILSYRKPVFWVLLAAVILCAVLALCFLTDPAGIVPKGAELDYAYFESLGVVPSEVFSVPQEMTEELLALLGQSGRRRFISSQYRNKALTLNRKDCMVHIQFTDGTSCQVRYAYSSGYDFLRGQEDDYLAIVTLYPTDWEHGDRVRQWVMSQSFDSAFEGWWERMMVVARQEAAQEPQ